ncbi:exopolygalacturonase-like [Olea europaea subsp. europaea]|uniref:Exopolygalacturonase-like n=1 Tax=Olea europaea subsp. europaea TaxID=158383 RepID=A0A8S0QKP0_OLEEU|nr:exopolygalacturonase-like [Olea europaea subsp. europaea]
MDSNSVFPRISLLVFLFIYTAYNTVNAVKVFNIRDNNGIPDGKTDNSQALLSTWEKVCKVDGGTVLVPSGIYYVKSALLQGPCIGQTIFSVIWIEFNQVDGLSITGNGIFDGQGSSTWAHNGNHNAKASSTCTASLKLKFVWNSSIEGITSKNSEMFHLHVNNCDGIGISHMSILAPKESPNTDGIHVSSSNNVRVSNVNIATGDDCISLGPGTTNIDISGITRGPGHGISIGSLGKYPDEKDVDGITVPNCTLSNTLNGVRIKTWAPSPPSIVSNVTFQDILLKNADNPVIIDQQYCPSNSCSHQGDSRVQIKDVKFVNIHGSSSILDAVNVMCSKSMPCQGIEFSGLNIIMNGNGQPTTATCSNVNADFLGNTVPTHCS